MSLSTEALELFRLSFLFYSSNLVDSTGLTPTEARLPEETSIIPQRSTEPQPPVAESSILPEITESATSQPPESTSTIKSTKRSKRSTKRREIVTTDKVPNITAALDVTEVTIGDATTDQTSIDTTEGDSTTYEAQYQYSKPSNDRPDLLIIVFVSAGGIIVLALLCCMMFFLIKYIRKQCPCSCCKKPPHWYYTAPPEINIPLDALSVCSNELFDLVETLGARHAHNE